MKNPASFGLQSNEEFVEINLMIEIKIFSNKLFRIMIQ